QTTPTNSVTAGQPPRPKLGRASPIRTPRTQRINTATRPWRQQSHRSDCQPPLDCGLDATGIARRRLARAGDRPKSSRQKRNHDQKTARIAKLPRANTDHSVGGQCTGPPTTQLKPRGKVARPAAGKTLRYIGEIARPQASASSPTNGKHSYHDAGTCASLLMSAYQAAAMTTAAWAKVSRTPARNFARQIGGRRPGRIRSQVIWPISCSPAHIMDPQTRP